MLLGIQLSLLLVFYVKVGYLKLLYFILTITWMAMYNIAMKSQRIITRVPFSSTEHFTTFHFPVSFFYCLLHCVGTLLPLAFPAGSCMLPAQCQVTNNVSNQLVNVVDHVAAKDSDISLRFF